MRKSGITFLCIMTLILLTCFPACQQDTGTPDAISFPIPQMQSTPTPSPAPVASAPEPEREDMSAFFTELLTRAEEYKKSGDFEDAIECYLYAMEGYSHIKPYLLLADLYMEYGQRSNALFTLKKALQDEYDSIPNFDKEEVFLAWWNDMVHADAAERQELSAEELQQIGELAYFIQETKCYIFSSELNKPRLLYPMYIYYSKYDDYDNEADIYSFSPRLSYPVETVAGGPSRPYSETLEGMTMDYAVVSADTVGRFVKDLLYAEVPWLHEDFRTEYDILSRNYFSCKNGKYYFEIGDYISCEYYVEGYQYLGDGQFYVILGEDWSRAPGNIDEAEYYISDRMHLILQRSFSAWGFTVVSKVRDVHRQDTVLRENWELPNRIIWVESAESMLQKYVP